MEESRYLGNSTARDIVSMEERFSYEFVSNVAYSLAHAADVLHRLCGLCFLATCGVEHESL